MSKKVLYQALSFIPVVAAAVVPSVTFVQSVDIVPYQRTTLYQSIAEPVPLTAAETVTVDKWLSPLSHPLASRKLPTADQQFIAFVRHDRGDIGWLEPLAEPVRFTKRPDGTLAFVPVVTPPTPGSGDVLFAQTIAAAIHHKTTLYQSVADPVPIVSGETVTVDKWFRPFDPPVKRATRPDGSSVLPLLAPPTTQWRQPLSEPVRSRAFPASEQQYLAFVKADPFPESVTADRWFRQLSEPTRRQAKPPEAASAFVPVVATPSPGSGDVLFSQVNQSLIVSKTTLYQSISEPVRFTATPPVVVSVDSWFVQLSTPPDAGFGFLDLSATFAAVEPSFGWYEPLSEPTRRKASVSWQQASFLVQPVTPAEVITVDKWFKAFAEPVRLRGLPASEQQSLAFVKAAPFPETVSIDRWLVPLSEPTRRKTKPPEVAGALVPIVTAPTPGSGDVLFSQTTVSVVYQTATIYQSAAEPVRFAPPEVVTVDKWYRDFGVPTRRILPVLSAATFQSNYLVPAPYVDPPMASWSYSWSLPVRLRTGLLAANQSGAVAPIIPIPNPPTPTGVYTVSGLYVTDQFTNNTVVYDYGGGVSHRTN